MKIGPGFFLILICVTLARAQQTPTWRYYRPGNTGIQGDINAALWVSPGGDPYIGGYDPSFEEGGFARFIQAENRWVNYSNVDYPVIGHPDLTGIVRVTDIVPDTSGQLWIGTWRGAMLFDPARGAASLERFGPGNSQLTDDMISDVECAPDGSLWFANQGTVRYSPATHSWARWNFGNELIAAQPKPGGGYLLWSASLPPIQDNAVVFDSDTQLWTTIIPSGAPGEVVGMPGKDCVDESGNFWALRTTSPGEWNSLDYRRPDGTWISPPEPYPSLPFNVWAFKAYGNGLALAVDGTGTVFQFNGSSWGYLGVWRSGEYTYAVDVDTAGNVWVCGLGGAAKRNVQTGTWQRYRLTNTANFDSFNRDITIDPSSGDVYTGANAGAGIGGMVRFDGSRWTCWDQLTYGLGYDWPFSNDFCQTLAFRPSLGRVAVNPYWSYGIHEWTGSGFNALSPNVDAKRMCEDSQGRLWALGEYYSLNYLDGNTWRNLPIVGWGATIRKDPARAGTVWAVTDYEIKRTDGSAFSFSRGIEDFPGSATWFTGFAADSTGVAWVGTWTQFTSTGSTLIRLNANNGSYTTFSHDQGWPFPGEHVRPLAITPDGRVWMQYDSEYPSTDAGLCWYDGTTVGSFPAPPGGVPQWGGLPNSSIDDLEVRLIPGGYELWMSCVSRGIAVLTVPLTTTSVNQSHTPTTFLSAQNYPNPFNPSTTIRYELPAESQVAITILNILGQEVATLVNEVQKAGSRSVEWNASNFASGVYYYRVQAGDGFSVKKMLLLK
jgi:hypothetical protein